jgi:acyl carrier protein
MDAVLNDWTGTRILNLVRPLLEKRGRGDAVDAGRNLREAGLTSLDMVNLMLAVEAEFDIVIPEAQMTPENFRSIDAIQALVGGLTPAA